MATVTGLTAARMLAIEDASIVDGEIDVSGHLILTTHGGTDIDAGVVTTPASDTVRGIVELATNAETATGTDATRAVTPAGLASMVSSETQKGIVELATNAETITGTDTVRAITPAGLKSVTDTINTAISGKQASDADLTTIAALTPTNNDTMQDIAGAWANRTTAQVKTTLAIAQSDVASLVTDLAAKAADSTVMHKADLVYNVKDYGALGDGTTDDATAITAAITASTFGSVVYFPVGTFIVGSTIKLLGGRTYQGAGRESSSVKMKNSTNLDAVMASETWLSTSITTSDNPINIRHLKINGNTANQSSGSGNGLALITFWNTLEDLEVINCRGNGILLTSKRRDNTEISNTAVECKIMNCAVRASGAIGIYVQDPTPSTQTVTDGWITNCVIDTTVGEGIFIDCAAGWLLEGNHFYGVAKSAIGFNRGGFTRIIGNYIENYGTSATTASYAGIMCGGDGANFIGTAGTIVIANNTIIYVSGGASGSTIRGIRLEASNSSVGHVVISGNGLYGATHTATSHGIRVSNQGASATLIIQTSGNLVFGWDTICSFIDGGGVLTVTGDIFQTPIATTSTDGFSRLPTCAGPPTGVPADLTKGLPLIYDTSGNKLWVYNGAWHSDVPTPITLTFASTLNTNAALGNYFRVTLTGNVTLAIPTNPTDGQTVTWEFLQDGTGSRTLTLTTGSGGSFLLGTTVTSTTLTTTASKRDLLTCTYNSSLSRWLVRTFEKGF